MRISDWSSDVCSSDLTFEITEDGIANITDLDTGEVLLTQNVEAGDIWRMCQAKDAAIRDWVKLAVTRARNSGMPAVFWLDPYRSEEHTSELQSLMRISYAVFCLKKKTYKTTV